MSDIPVIPLSPDGTPLAQVPQEPKPMSAEWYTQMVAINEANLRQAQANAALKAKELREAEDVVQRLGGGLEALKALQGLQALATSQSP